MIYSVFSYETGEIVKVIDCPASLIELQFDPLKQGCVEGGYPAQEWYFENGKPVEKPPKPSEFHVFDYTTKQWIDPRTPETEWPLVRAKRDRLIAATDWTQLPDVPLATKEMWANYRQALRDVTLQPDPFNIVWPVAP